MGANSTFMNSPGRWSVCGWEWPTSGYDVFLIFCKEASMTEQTRRRIVDRKIVEMMMKGIGVNAIALHLHVAKRRIRGLLRKTIERRYVEANGKLGPVGLPAYPEAVFPDPVDRGHCAYRNRTNGSIRTGTGFGSIWKRVGMQLQCLKNCPFKE
jgi:hypothetical protein